MSQQLTKQEIEQRNQEVKNAIKVSSKLEKNFNVYIAVFQSETRAQTSHITKEEHDKMQKRNFIGSSHEDNFFKDMPDDDHFATSKTLVLNKENYGMAFHPMIWQVLTLPERVAVCRIAWKDIFKRDVKEFCNYDSNGVVMVGKKYQGALNVGSFFSDDIISFDILKGLFNGNNIIKNSLYINRLISGKKYDKITDFESLEEMQYISPIEPVEEDVSKMNDEARAYYFNHLYRRRYREAVQKSLDLISVHGEELTGLFPTFDNYVNQEQRDITNTNLLVMKTLGFSSIQRDKDYLEMKVMLFNKPLIEKHNELYKEYVKVKKEQVDVVNKPYQEKYDELQKQVDAINEKIKNANDAIEIYDYEEKLKPIQEEQRKLKNTMATNNNRILKPILDAVDAVDSQKVTYEQTLEYFKKDFEKREFSKGEQSKSSKSEHTEKIDYDTTLN